MDEAKKVEVARERASEQESLDVPKRDRHDAVYAKITAKTLEEDHARLRAEAEAEEARRKADTPPPDTRTPQEKAAHLRELADANFLHHSMRSANGPVFDAQTFKVYLEDYLTRAGAPADPLEQMLLQQLLQAHLAINRLHVRASASSSLDEATACIAAIGRLMGEFRRGTLAVQVYREAAADKKVADRASRQPKAKCPARRKNTATANGAKIHARSEQGSNGHHRLSEYFHEPEPVLA